MSRPPDIIYILSDEHYGALMGHLGDASAQTPHMDAMAAEGASLTRAFANCPICTPSRGTIFSGRHAHAGPVQAFFDVFKPAAPSTATVLREHGYHTAYFGKWHCGFVRDQRPPKVRENPSAYNADWAMRTPEHMRGGFQDWCAFEVNNAPFKLHYWKDRDVNPTKQEGYQTDILTDLAMEYLDEYDRDEPLFLVLSVEPPHFPVEAPQEYVDRFDPDSLEVPDHFVDTTEMRQWLATYYAMVTNLDDNIGRLRAKLAAHPRFRENTLTTYISDHGDFCGRHGLNNKKEKPHEESVRIPAIFHYPEAIPAGQQPDAMFGLVDMMATTLGLAGLDVPPHNQGVDFSPLLRNESFERPDAILLEMQNNPRWSLDLQDWRAVRTETHKYVVFETGDELLFDLVNDPTEQENLVASEPALRDELRARLRELLLETRDPYWDVILDYGVTPPQDVYDVSHRGPSKDSLNLMVRDGRLRKAPDCEDSDFRPSRML